MKLAHFRVNGRLKLGVVVEGAGVARTAGVGETVIDLHLHVATIEYRIGVGVAHADPLAP